jgi:nucleotide-binding universal stress UspA family protein
MLPIRIVLHPTDFSERSAYAFRLACSLARDYGARLIAVHVAPPPIINYGEGVIPPAPQHQQEELLAKLESLNARDSRVHVDHRLVDGDPASEILRVAKETNSDVIFMGTHGRTGVGRLLMGSVAEQVVRKAPCAVVTVRAPIPQERAGGD